MAQEIVKLIILFTEHLHGHSPTNPILAKVLPIRDVYEKFVLITSGILASLEFPVFMVLIILSGFGNALCL